MKIRDIIPVAKGTQPARVVIKNAQIFNVFSGAIERNNIAIYRKRIAGIGEYHSAEHYIDANKLIALPGFIDAHLHIESSMLTPRQFVKSILTRGTTTIIADPHEIANVVGIAGIEFIIKSTQGVPLNVYISIPSAVPATSFETSGDYLGADDMLEVMDRYKERVIALGEVMNYPGVLNRDPELIAKIEILRHHYKKIDGHAPGLTGKELNAYICAFIRSDHECSNKDEALEKISRGMQIFIREGSAARDLDALLPAVNATNHPYFSFCTDDRDPLAILNEGHIDYLVRRAIAKGIDPILAIRMATINTARHFGLRSMGAIAPGYKADMVFVDNLKQMNIKMVVKDGNVVVKDGQFIANDEGDYCVIPDAMGSIHICNLNQENLKIKAEKETVRAIKVSDGSLITDQYLVKPLVKDGFALADPNKDLAKIIVIDRHKASGYTLGFIHGLNIKKGAVATSVGHDAHNLCAAGMNDTDMLVAIQYIKDNNGGLVVVNENKILASLPLPIAGLMSNKDLDTVVSELTDIRKGLKVLGTEKEIFMNLSFVQLAVIPNLRITNKGIFDSAKFQFKSLWRSE